MKIIKIVFCALLFLTFCNKTYSHNYVIHNNTEYPIDVKIVVDEWYDKWIKRLEPGKKYEYHGYHHIVDMFARAYEKYDIDMKKVNKKYKKDGYIEYNRGNWENSQKAIGKDAIGQGKYLVDSAYSKVGKSKWRKTRFIEIYTTKGANRFANLEIKVGASQ